MNKELLLMIFYTKNKKPYKTISYFLRGCVGIGKTFTFMCTYKICYDIILSKLQRVKGHYYNPFWDTFPFVTKGIFV
jgi:hypothetical protein